MTSQRFFLKKGNVGAGPKTQVACIAVINGGDKILMGKRRDNNRWTCPGGHMDEGETPAQGAQRELYEETEIGLTPTRFKPMGYKDVVSPQGKKIRVHTFKVKYSGPTSMSNDPDNEVFRWRWLDINNMPKDVMKNLHNGSKDVIFEKLGIYDKNKKLVIKSDKRLVVKKKDMAKEHKRLIHVLKTPSHKDDLKEAKIQEKELKEEYSKAMKFVIDIIKARPHKYLRKFRRGGEWIYVYHEGEKKPKRLDEHAVRALKVLAERRMKGAHTLMEGVEEIPETKIRALLALSDRGHEKAQTHLSELGIDHKTESLHRSIAANPLKAAASQGIKSNLIDALGKSNESTLGYLSGYESSEPAKKIISAFGSMDAAKAELSAVPTENVYDAINGVHEVMNKIDEAQAELFSGDTLNTQNSSAKKGYGNLGFNRFIEHLETKGILPEGYKDVIERKRGEALTIPDPRKIEEEREQRAREAAERLQRENAELYETHGENLENMVAYFGQRLNDEKKVNLMKGMDKFFGKDFSFKNLDEYLNLGNPEVKIKLGRGFINGLVSFGEGSSSSGSIDGSVSIEKVSGGSITSASRSIKKKSDGSITWSNGSFSRPSNSNLSNYSGMSIGLYGGVEMFLKEVTANYTGDAKKNTRVVIGSCANDSWDDGYKGAIIWAKHFFAFESESDLRQFKEHYTSNVKSYMERAGATPEEIRSVKSKISRFKFPYQFVKLGYGVNKADGLRAVQRSSFDFDYNSIYRAKEKVDIGELMLVDWGMSWGSAYNYVNQTTGDYGKLNRLRTTYYNNQRQRLRSA